MRKKALFYIMDKRGQSTLETAILIIVIVASLILMQVYLKRAVQGRVREGIDSIGGQYDPAQTTSDYTTTHNSTSITNSSTAVISRTTGSVTYDVAVTTSDTQFSDNTTNSGYEIVAAP